jgi:hypothetical protein
VRFSSLEYLLLVVRGAAEGGKAESITDYWRRPLFAVAILAQVRGMDK